MKSSNHVPDGWEEMQGNDPPLPLEWLADVWQQLGGDEPDDDGEWLMRLEGWLVGAKQQLERGKRDLARKRLSK